MTASDITASRGPETGQVVAAVRGGSWFNDVTSCQTTFRGEGRDAAWEDSTLGFRLVAIAR